jgi:Na+-driven multidrug efflux pump
MRPSPIMTSIIGLFLAGLGFALVYASLSHWHADSAWASLIGGSICLAISAVAFWGSLKWR